MSDEGFLSRWSKRKAAVADGRVESELPNTSTAAAFEAKMPQTAEQTDTLPAVNPRPPLPSIESLTHASDFTPFMARDVAPALRNKAVRMLFTDPHFNVMDGLDTYIDDYGKPDPLPLEWLKNLQQSKSLRLFEETPDESDVIVDAPADSPLAESPALADVDGSALPPEPLDVHQPQKSQTA